MGTASPPLAPLVLVTPEDVDRQVPFHVYILESLYPFQSLEKPVDITYFPRLKPELSHLSPKSF